MPQWALIPVIVWLVLGFISVWFWQRRGDGKLAFFLHLSIGFIIAPATLGFFVVQDIQSMMALRRAKRESSKTPVGH